MEIKLRVGNLAYETSEEDLRMLFSQAGAVVSVALMKDRDTGESKGFAFIEMTTPAEAQKAIDMFNAYALADRELKVNAAKPAARPRAAPGGYQSRFSAFSLAGQEQKVKTSQPHSPGSMQSGYQTRFSAFGNGSHGPAGPRRRGGGSQRH